MKYSVCSFSYNVKQLYLVLLIFFRWRSFYFLDQYKKILILSFFPNRHEPVILILHEETKKITRKLILFLLATRYEITAI